MAAGRAAWPAALVLAAGCASTLGTRGEPTGKEGYLGLEVCPVKDGLLAGRVVTGSPADKAGIHGGDVLTGSNGQDLVDPERRRAFLSGVRGGAGGAMSVTLTRHGLARSVEATPRWKERYAEDDLAAALTDEIVSGRKVAVAAIIARVSHARPETFKNALALGAWESATRASLRKAAEGLLLGKRFSRCSNFSVVDRESTARAVGELRLQASEALAPETAKQLGKLTGASHLLFVTMTRSSKGADSYEDDIHAAVFSAETGASLVAVGFRRSVSR